MDYKTINSYNPKQEASFIYNNELLLCASSRSLLWVIRRSTLITRNREQGSFRIMSYCCVLPSRRTHQVAVVPVQFLGSPSLPPYRLRTFSLDVCELIFYAIYSYVSSYIYLPIRIILIALWYQDSLLLLGHS